MIPKKRFENKVLLTGLIFVMICFFVWSVADIEHLSQAPVFQHASVARAEDPESTGVQNDSDPNSLSYPQEEKAPDAEAQLSEIKIIMTQLEEKRNALKEKEAALKKDREKLESLKKDIEDKLEQLSAVQKKIDEGLVKKAEIEEKAKQQKEIAEQTKIKHLVKMYTSMNPKKAAEIIDKMDLDVVHQVFTNMKGDQVGKILSYVNRDRAAKITERLAPSGLIGEGE